MPANSGLEYVPILVHIIAYYEEIIMPYITRLHKVKPGTKFLHCKEQKKAVKNCDAFQTLIGSGKEVIFGRNDLVEVRSSYIMGA